MKSIVRRCFCCSIWRILVNFEKQHNFSVNLLVAAVSSFLNRKSSISLKILCVKMKVFFSIQHATSSKIVFSSAICCVPYWTTLLSNSLRRRDADFAEQKRSFKGKVGQANDGQFFGETWANITKATFEEVALNFYDLGLLKKALKWRRTHYFDKKRTFTTLHYCESCKKCAFLLRDANC